MRNQLHYVGLTKIHARPTTWWLPGRTFPRKRCGQVWEPPLGHYKYRLMLHIATHTHPVGRFHLQISSALV
jgi:hypothetical protein